MKLIHTIAIALMLTPSLASAQAVDWTAHLRSSPESLQRALDSNADCSITRFSVPVHVVHEGTTVEADLFSPVVRGNPGWGLIRADDLRIDRDENRRYVAEDIHRLICTIGREATVSAYIYDDKVFRINLTFDRCRSRKEVSERFGVPLPFTYLSCEGVDAEEKDFDRAVFGEIQSRRSYGYNQQGNPGYFNRRWNGFMRGEYGVAERKILNDLKCTSREAARREIPTYGQGFRCIIDVSNNDPARWSGTAMYEFLSPGTISDSVVKRLIAKRIFVDIPAEGMAAASMVPHIEAMVDDIKREISDRVNSRNESESAISNILGAQE